MLPLPGHWGSPLPLHITDYTHFSTLIGRSDQNLGSDWLIREESKDPLTGSDGAA